MVKAQWFNNIKIKIKNEIKFNTIAILPITRKTKVFVKSLGEAFLKACGVRVKATQHYNIFL